MVADNIELGHGPVQSKVDALKEVVAASKEITGKITADAKAELADNIQRLIYSQEANLVPKASAIAGRTAASNIINNKYYMPQAELMGENVSSLLSPKEVVKQRQEQERVDLLQKIKRLEDGKSATPSVDMPQEIARQLALDEMTQWDMLKDVKAKKEKKR
jgi:hypothetical protein